MTFPFRAPLLVVATEAEAQAFASLGWRTVVSGVGAVSAALATQAAIFAERPDVVLCAGIGGSYPGSGLRPGDAALASEMVFAGLGARDGEVFLPLSELGLETLPGLGSRFPAWPGTPALAARLGVPCGPFLTLETVTGDAQTAAALRHRHPGALIEGMEGAGVAQAAFLAGLPALEVRGVSNAVGPRDRASWQIGAALEACRQLLGGLSLNPT